MSSRTTVLWSGAPPPEKSVKEFKVRGLDHVHVVDAATAEKFWNSSRAAVFVNPTDADFALLAGGALQEALAHGLAVKIVVPRDQLLQRMAELKHVPALGLSGWVMQTHANPVKIAEEFARHEPGPAHNILVNLHGQTEGLSTEQRVLLERAFHDCSEVHLQKMPDGTAQVFLAFAKLTTSEVGEYPLPLFVKIDKRKRAETERAHYHDCTTSFVPFYARPNLHLKRCLMGAEFGLIVGDFVERSEGLLELAHRGDAQSAIDSLFQDALRGWRAQPFDKKNETVKAVALCPKGFLSRLSTRRKGLLAQHSEAAKALGALLDVFEVERRLDALPDIMYRKGFTHGDLHCGNVRARAGEAILIDFQSVGAGPLSTDPATLEVSLALEFQSATEADWHATMAQLYSIDNLRAVPRPRQPTAPLNPLWEAVRQIRRYGLADQIADDEYARAVAIQLLRKASHECNGGEDPSRRPLLIKLAAAIVLALETPSANEGKFLAEAR